MKVLIRRQEKEDESQQLANEWRQVAQVLGVFIPGRQVVDRLLFWLFLSCTTVITTVLLIAIPAWHRSHESGDFDESLYGLHK